MGADLDTHATRDHQQLRFGAAAQRHVRRLARWFRQNNNRYRHAAGVNPIHRQLSYVQFLAARGYRGDHQDQPVRYVDSAGARQQRQGSADAGYFLQPECCGRLPTTQLQSECLHREDDPDLL